jgi:ubiquitin carboxyl-terminal hydrolase 5/13
MEWVFAHMEDADFNDPLPDPQAAAAAAASSSGGGGGGGSGSKADPEAIGQLSAMGFTDVQASAALQVILSTPDLHRY